MLLQCTAVRCTGSQGHTTTAVFLFEASRYTTSRHMYVHKYIYVHVLQVCDTCGTHEASHEHMNVHLFMVAIVVGGQYWIVIIDYDH